MSVEATIAGMPGEIFGARIGDTYRENWRFLDAVPGVWDEVEAGRAVVINEQLSRRAGLHVGEMLTLAAGLSLPVAGVVGDYGNPIGQAIVCEALFRRSFPHIVPSRYGVRTGDPQGLRHVLVERMGLPPARITDQAALKAFSLSVFERTFSVTGALNVLTLAVAAFAILMSLLTLAAMRLPQMAPVWAMGTTQRRLAGLEDPAHRAACRDHHCAGLAARLGARLGSAGYRQCRSVWLAPADVSISRGIRPPDAFCARRRAARRALASLAAGAHGAGCAAEDIRP